VLWDYVCAQTLIELIPSIKSRVVIVPQFICNISDGVFCMPKYKKGPCYPLNIHPPPRSHSQNPDKLPFKGGKTHAGKTGEFFYSKIIMTVFPHQFDKCGILVPIYPG